MNNRTNSVLSGSGVNHVTLNEVVKYSSNSPQIVSIVFLRLGVEVLNFNNCQHKIFSECSVFLSSEYVILEDFFGGLTGEGKLNYKIFCTTLHYQRS